MGIGPAHTLSQIAGEPPTYTFLTINDTLMYKNYITQEQHLILDYK